jgi:hypothetical protein
MKYISALLLLSSVALSTNALSATPYIVYNYSGDSETPIGAIDLQAAYTEPMSNCGQFTAFVKVREIAYDGPTEIIAGFRAIMPKSDGVPTLFRIYGTEFTLPQMRELAKIIKPDASVLVLYQICGMGHYSSVREVWLGSAIMGLQSTD